MKKNYAWSCDYGDPLRVESKFSLNESVERLSKITRDKSWGSIRNLGLPTKGEDSEFVGSVSKDNVNIYRVRRSIYHSGKPHFEGRFVEAGGRVVLEGDFGCGWLQKLSFWFVLPVLLLLILFVVFSFFEPSTSPFQKVVTALFAIGAFFVFGVIRKYSQKFINNDIKWISEEITQALQINEEN